MSRSVMTLNPHNVLPKEWQEVKSEAMSVNEADYSSVILCTAGPEERQRRCGVGVVVRRWSYPAHTGNEVSSCVGSEAERL